MPDDTMPPIWYDSLVPVWIEMQDNISIRVGAFLRHEITAVACCPWCGMTLMVERHQPPPPSPTVVMEIRTEEDHHCPRWPGGRSA